MAAPLPNRLVYFHLPRPVSLWSASIALTAALLTGGQAAPAQVKLSGSAATSFPVTTIGASAPAQNVLLQVTAMETISGIIVPVSQGGKQEYVVGKISGCAVDGTTNNLPGAVCTVPVTFSPAYPGDRPSPLQVATSAGAVNVALHGTGKGPLAVLSPGLLHLFAGSGSPGVSGDGGQATAAELSYPSGATVDSAGNLYFADSLNHTVRKINPVSGIITRVAGDGNGDSGYTGDGGPGTSATLAAPSDVAVDGAGNVYIADTGNNVIRRVDGATGVITTIAGKAAAGYTGDGGAATSATLNGPRGLAVDIAGNLYIADTGNDVIRKITSSTGIITTVAGNGQGGSSGDGGPALSASFNIKGVAVDAAGNLYLADPNNNVVRMVTAATGIITTVVGNSSDNYDFAGDGGPATAAFLSGPTYVKLDAAGNLYVADYGNGVIRKVFAATGIINTIVGNTYSHTSPSEGEPASLPGLDIYGLAVDNAGNLFATELNQGLIYEVQASVSGLSYLVTTVVGTTDSLDGPQPLTLANDGNDSLSVSAPTSGTNPTISPAWLLDSGSTCPQLKPGNSGYTVASGNGCAYALDFAPTVAGANTGSLAVTDNSLNATHVTQTAALSGTGRTARYTETDLSSSANPSAPGQTVTFTAVVTSDEGGGTPSGSVVFTIGGTPMGSAVTLDANGKAVSAAFTGAAIQGVYVTATFTPKDAAAFAASSSAPLEQSVVEGAAALVSTGTATGFYTFPTTALGSSSTGQSITFKTTAAVVLKSITVSPSQGAKQEFVVGSITGCTVNGTATTPSGTTCTVPVTFAPAYPGVRSAPLQIVTTSGNLNLGLSGIGTGPLAALLPGVVSTIAGTGVRGATGDGGPAINATLDNLDSGLTVDHAGNIYFATGNLVRRIDAVTGMISTVAGGGTGYLPEGTVAVPGTDTAFFGDISDLAIDSAGNLLISSPNDQVVVKLNTATGLLTLFAGDYDDGPSGDGGPAILALITAPTGLAVDANGNVYIADSTSHNVRRVDAATGKISTVTSGLVQPDALALDGAGNLDISDYKEEVIFKVNLSTSAISIVAGSTATDVYSGDGGPATSAGLTDPTFIKIDAAGDLYIADLGNSVIRKVSAATGIITTIAGTYYDADDGDGPDNRPAEKDGLAATSVALNGYAIALDGAGNLYLSDPDQFKLYKVAANSSAITFPTPTAVGTPDTADDPQTATLANIGNSALTLPKPAMGTNPSIAAGWSLDSKSTCPSLTTTSAPYSLSAGAGCTYAVDFAPTAAGTSTGTLNVTDNSLNVTNTMQTADLTANSAPTAIATTIMVTSVSPSPAVYGQTVTLKAKVAYASGSGVPAGIVFFSDDVTGTITSEGTVDGSGMVTLTAALTTGTFQVTATFFPSSTTVASSTSAPVTLVVRALSFPTPAKPDTFLVTRNDDPLTGNVDIDGNDPGMASGCVNQTPGAKYQTGGTDNSLCSLRNALAAAGGTSGAVITFAPSVASVAKPGVITVGDSGMTVLTAVTIQGPGMSALTISNPLFSIQAAGMTVFDSLTMADAADVPLENDFGQTTLTYVNILRQGDAVAMGGGGRIDHCSFLTPSSGINLFGANIQVSDTVFQGGSVAAEVGGLSSFTNVLVASNTNIEDSLYPGAPSDPGFYPDQQGGSVLILDTGAVATVSNSVFDGNTGTYGGAMFLEDKAQVTISDTTFSNNTAQYGAAIYLSGSSSALIANTTFGGNVATTQGILDNEGTGSLTIRNSTLYDNTLGTKGGQLTYTTNAPTLIDSILAGDNGVPASGVCAGCKNGGHNLIGVDPKLLALGNYGPTGHVPALQTFLPMPGSPAVCAGAAAVDNTDERGYPRPNGTCYDIGADQNGYTLAFTVQPSNTTLGKVIAPAPSVRLTDHGLEISTQILTLSDSLGTSALKGTLSVPTNATGDSVFSAIMPAQTGAQTLTATFGSLSITSESFNVTAAGKLVPTVTLTVNPASQTYGVGIPAGTLSAKATYSGSAVAGTFVYTALPSAGGNSVSITPGSTILPVGTYTITAAFTPTDSSTYSSSSSSASAPNYTVTKSAATVTLSALSATYDGNPHAATATTKPAALGTSITYNGSATIPTDAGSYTVIATITDANYSGSATGTLIIAKAAATVIIGNLTATYDGNPHAATATTKPAGLSTSITYNGSSTAPKAVGSYPVVATITDPNYTGSATGTLVISSSSQTATVTLSNLSATYDGTVHAATATTIPVGLAVSLTYSGSASAPSAAGSYAVVATVTASGYNGSTKGTLIIAKAAATVALGNLSATYDGNPHAATVTTEPANLSTSLTYNGSSTAPTAAGSYPVVATVTDSDYTGSATGTLVIAKAAATITLTNLAVTFDGASHAATATTKPAGLSSSLTYSGTTTAPTSAGSYAVVATVTDSNYTGSASGTLVIAKAAATITLSDLAATYDGSPHAATASTTPAGLSTSITYSGSPTVPSALGSYTVVATITDANYTGSATGTLVISPPPIPPDFTFTASGSNAQTITSSGTASFSFSLAPNAGGFPSDVTFSQTGALPGSTVTFTPSSVAQSAGAQTVTMTINSKSNAALDRNSNPSNRRLPIVLAFLFLPLVACKKWRKGIASIVLLVLALFIGTISMSGCGSSDSRIYSIVVTATAGPVQHTSTVSLTVR
jgi:sugar lactone lactonase YvrE